MDSVNKIKVVEFINVWVSGGAEKYIVNILKNIDKEKFSIVLWTTQINKNIYSNEINNESIETYPTMYKRWENPIIRMIHSFPYYYRNIKKSGVDVIHIHAGNGVEFVYALLAKKAGIKKVIIHSHNSSFGDKNRSLKYIGHNVGKKLLGGYVDELIACSDLAGEWLFRKKDQNKITIFKYIVDVDKFRFNKETRTRLRKQYGLMDEIVYLNVGRFHFQENHEFLIQLFFEIHKNQNSKLFLIGEGKEELNIKKQIQKYEIEDDVIIVGTTDKVEEYMWMSDVFLLPSLFEGNPITSVEAQASGLPCFISDRVTDMAFMLETTAKIRIDNAHEGAMKILECQLPNDDERIKCNNTIKSMGYDIKKQISELEKLYSD